MATDAEKLVNAINNNKHLNSQKYLEKILKEKCAKKIADTLKN